MGKLQQRSLVFSAYSAVKDYPRRAADSGGMAKGGAFFSVSAKVKMAGKNTKYFLATRPSDTTRAGKYSKVTPQTQLHVM